MAYYPKSNYWDQLANKRALGYAINPQQLRAAMEGERLGELSAYAIADEKRRNRELEKERMDKGFAYQDKSLAQQNAQFYSAQANSNAMQDKSLDAQETAAKSSLMVQAPITALGVYGMGRQAGLWGGTSTPALSSGNWWDKMFNTQGPSGIPGESPYYENFNNPNWLNDYNYGYKPDVGLTNTMFEDPFLNSGGYNTGTGYGGYNADFPAAYDQFTGPDSYMNMGGLPANTGEYASEAALSAPWVAGEYGAQGGIGTGIGELASGWGGLASGIGSIAGLTGAAYMLADKGIPALNRWMDGPTKTIQEYSTDEIINQYKTGQFGFSGAPVFWNELQRRGATGGLNAPTEQQIYEASQDYKYRPELGGGWA